MAIHESPIRRDYTHSVLSRSIPTKSHQRKKDTHKECPFRVGDPKYKNVEYGNFIKDEYTHTLRLKSKLFDLRVGYANPYSKRIAF